MNKTTLIDFPCHFPVKIIGANLDSFINAVLDITKTHFSSFEEQHFTHKKSNNNNYLAITVTVYAENQETLDAFYREITKLPDVKMVL